MSETFKCGDIVVWRSSNTDKIGRVVAVIPAGNHPGDAGVSNAFGESRRRDHESYVIRGGETWPRGKVNLYWPRASLLDATDPVEVAATLKHCSPKLRALIEGSAA